jgi:signal transduction histidine kinase
MQQAEHTGDLGSAGRRRVEAVVKTLATLGCHGESLAEVAHDARNMVTALGLYCDLLDEPGVLAVAFAHYSNELRLVAAASRRLVEKLVALDAQAADEPDLDRPGPDCPDLNRLGSDPLGCADEPASGGWTADGLPAPALRRALNQSLEQSLEQSLDQSLDRTMSGLTAPSAAQRDPERRGLERRGPERRGLERRGLNTGASRSRRWESIFAEPIHNLAAELAANRNLLAALAGSRIAVSVDAAAGACAVHLTAEDLTRLLVNMVRNAAEAMPSGGRIHIALAERPAFGAAPGRLVLAIEDTGPGIPAELLERVFQSGFTTHSDDHASGRADRRNGSIASTAGWPAAHRGLGLAITRAIIEAAGGHISAVNRTSRTGADADTPLRGARFEIELPVRNP